MSIPKRRIIGAFLHALEALLRRNLYEFNFHYSSREGLGINAAMCTDQSPRGIAGKSLTDRRPSQAANA